MRENGKHKSPFLYEMRVEWLSHLRQSEAWVYMVIGIGEKGVGSFLFPLLFFLKKGQH